MAEVCIEYVEGEVVIYHPGTMVVTNKCSSLDEALAFARGEWPDLGIHLITSMDVGMLLDQTPPKCAHCG